MPDTTSVLPAEIDNFAALRRYAQSQGLFERQPMYYTWKLLQIALMFGVSVAILFVAESFWIRMLDALLLAFTLGQIAFLVHDAGHRQIFAKSRWDDLIGHGCAILLGGSLHSWMDKHNEHHAHPNHEDMDPDIDFPFLAFSEKQARDIRRDGNAAYRFVVRHQGALLLPVMSLVGFSLRVTSWSYLLHRENTLTNYWRDWLTSVLNLSLYASLFLFLPPLHALAFILLSQLAWGVYMGSVFAPNHKGMPIIDAGMTMDYLTEQVITSRNVRGSLITDVLYGGLNYQVEHHLFPTMPRNRLRFANAMVREYCARKSIPYHETSVLESYREIVTYMQGVALYFRSLTPGPDGAYGSAGTVTGASDDLSRSTSSISVAGSVSIEAGTDTLDDVAVAAEEEVKV